VYICARKWYNIVRGDFVVEAYRKGKIDKLLRKLLSRKVMLENEVQIYDEGSTQHSIITGQIIELNYIIGDIKIDFKLEEEKK
jgi:hypothetical protein